MGAGRSVKLPLDVDLQNGTMYNDWKYWEAEFENHLDNTNNKVKILLLCNTVGSTSARIITLLIIPAEDTQVYSKIKELLNGTSTLQEKGETFEHFLTSLRELVKNCNYNRTIFCGENEQMPGDSQCEENKTLQDRVMHGICDKAIQEALMRMDYLTLEKAATHCRVWEHSRQVNLIHKSSEESESSELVNAVKHRRGNSIAEGEVKQ
ncbi:hypothetical protein PR048_006704 [Dryococelus australis]|uniref:Uncharacterized protein n=1 Tax=Dryococelus australis TaxID=614101 RepID=A0ABQ9IBP2_9NEOP|nr:hypothetical protein PR048_006704 [Dryococelus australis]